MALSLGWQEPKLGFDDAGVSIALLVWQRIGSAMDFISAALVSHRNS
jgi:hypothetical protein